MRDTTPADLSRTSVVMWTDDPVCLVDLRRRVPSSVAIVMNDRPGRPDAQPSMRNKAIDLARASGCEAFVTIHNDVRPARGWLPLLVDDWREAEKRWGKRSSVISPRLIPYHVTPPHPESGVRADSDLWTKKLPTGRDSMSTEQIERGAGRSRRMRFGSGMVKCAARRIEDPLRRPRAHDFMASPHFFNDVGGCDETMTGVNYDDTDWAIRAYQAGKRNLQSKGSLIGHVGAFTLTMGHRPRRIDHGPTTRDCSSRSGEGRCGMRCTRGNYGRGYSASSGAEGHEVTRADGLALISVIVPTMNRPTLARTVQSAEGADEVIVVGDHAHPTEGQHRLREKPRRSAGSSRC